MVNELDFYFIKGLPAYQYTGIKDNIASFLRRFNVILYPIEGQEEPNLIIYTKGIHRPGYEVKPTAWVIVDKIADRLFVIEDEVMRTNFPERIS